MRAVWCHVPCPPRFLVHRYSVLRQHAEANGVEGLDALDPPATATKGGYHDDSDEVSVGWVPLSPPPSNGSIVGGHRWVTGPISPQDLLE